MKIQLTTAEAAELIRDHLRRTDAFISTADVTITVTPPVHAFDGRKTLDLMALHESIRPFSSPHSGAPVNKIAAIKALRAAAEAQGFATGLSDLKRFVEAVLY
jgi:hypothetical protein